MSVTPDHPKQRLLFALEPDFAEDVVQRVEALVAQVANSRRWVLSPPLFVNEEEARESPSDAPIRTVGAFLDIYTALGEWAGRLPPEIDRAHFEEVSLLVREFSVLSAETGVEVAVELDDDQIGWIERGAPDEGISQTFLGEWERSLLTAAGR